MDRSRIVILALAGVAAIVAALIVRALVSDGPKVAIAAAPRPAAMINVLVAANDIRAGEPLTPAAVRWERWPQASSGGAYLTAPDAVNTAPLVEGMVARVPLIAGEPLSTTKIIRAHGVGFLAGQLQDGMRAVSVNINEQTGAAGFILPNDHVDVLMSRSANEGGATRTILTDVRVLAIGQMLESGRSDKNISAKTATLEVSPIGAERLARANVAGVVTLALRPLADGPEGGGQVQGNVTVYRYGQNRATGQGQD